ncbi:hypothetical protein [Nonomuraea rubra]
MGAVQVDVENAVGVAVGDGVRQVTASADLPIPPGPPMATIAGMPLPGW